MAEEELDDEFVLIPHCGGRVTFNFDRSESGTQVSASHIFDSPFPASMFGVWALPNGKVVGTGATGWHGAGVPRPPSADSIEVQIASDRETMFGRHCHGCDRYFRTNSAPFLWNQTCPYCGKRAPTHFFTTPAQSRYVQHYIKKMIDGLNSDLNEVTIDLDKISDAVARGLEKPVFLLRRGKAAIKV